MYWPGRQATAATHERESQRTFESDSEVVSQKTDSDVVSPHYLYDKKKNLHLLYLLCIIEVISSTKKLFLYL